MASPRNKVFHCKARRINDEMQCGRCGLAWAVRELPPPCRNVPAPALASPAKSLLDGYHAPEQVDLLPKEADPAETRRRLAVQFIEREVSETLGPGMAAARLLYGNSDACEIARAVVGFHEWRSNNFEGEPPEALAGWLIRRGFHDDEAVPLDEC